MVSPNEAALRRCRRAVIFPFLPTAGCFLFSPFFLPTAGYFLSLAKESNQRTPFKERGISISPRTRRARSAYDFCKAKIGFLTERERNPLMGFFHTIFLSDGFRPVRPLPFGNLTPGVSGDYQIAPLPRSGKGRWRPLAAGRNKKENGFPRQ